MTSVMYVLARLDPTLSPTRPSKISPEAMARLEYERGRRRARR